jgi:hypothetical protein
MKTSLISLSSHVQSNILNLSKTFHRQIQSLSFTFHGLADNLSGQMHGIMDGMNNNLPPPPSSSSSSVTSMTQDTPNLKLTVSSGYSVKVTNGNMVVNTTSYDNPSTTPDTSVNYGAYRAGIALGTGTFNTSPSSMLIKEGSCTFNIPAGTATNLKAFGGYTIEFYFKQLSGSATNPNYLYGGSNYVHRTWIDPSTRKMMYSIGNGTAWTASGTGTQTVQLNTWYHIAFQKKTTDTFEYFFNGQKEATLVNTASGTALLESQLQSNHCFGSFYGGGVYYYSGYIDTLRLSSTARYSGNTYTTPISTSSDRYTLDPYTVYVNYFSSAIDWSATFNGSGNESYLYSAPSKKNGYFQLKKLKNSYTTYTAYIDSNGNVNRNASDERLKTNITPITSTLDKIHALNPVQFKWKDSDCLDWGFIAQQVQRDFESGLVFQNINGYLGLHITKLIPFLVKGVQELSTKLDLLKQKYN